MKNCPICNKSNFNKFYTKKWNSSSFVKCKKCSLIFQNPQETIEETTNRYNHNYFNYEVENQYNFFNLVKKTLNDFNILNILPKNAKILEIGSATGLFLKYMNENGFDSVGVELCKESCEYGRKNFGVNLLNCRLEDAYFNQNYFDFIHFSHLIEHLNNPTDFIKFIYKLTKPNGFVMITTPNSSGLFSKYYEENWRCIVDDHLFLFNKKNLKKLFTDNNFEIIGIKTWGSIPAGKSKLLKKIFDWFVKKVGVGDVVCFLLKRIS
ncbi:MAG: hypothetical protein A2086_12725 [Spirochaetes bacterium GWD1_27_9]|nr:MAG: hypothetical protein A2Z98_17345 [Spirochaetes bacterium GWB1_27_13]OHD21313.1 MAG: hypothetical protein A2Y34_06365 [Spirochaetes bacterium GWC1_27_15]OHD33726.1 MAG: hypothetical protein A2086_12725 [Spirochaetes bacterium GWD1_27_9]